MRSNREYARLAVERGEITWRLGDLRDQQSHTLKAYNQDSGLEVVKDKNHVNRAIKATYSLDTKHTALDRPKLPLAQHFGVRQAIGQVPAAKQLEIAGLMPERVKTISKTVAGGKRAPATNKHGLSFYKLIGSKGGKISKGGGFAMIRELAVEAGKKGGAASRKKRYETTD